MKWNHKVFYGVRFVKDWEIFLVVVYYGFAFAVLLLLMDPLLDVLSQKIRVAVFTAASARPLDCG